MEIVVHKVRHIPTGLFYQPVKGRWSENKSNLSKRGKIYETKQYPKRPHKMYLRISSSLVKEFGVTVSDTRFGNQIISEEKDWEVVEYKLVEL